MLPIYYHMKDIFKIITYSQKVWVQDHRSYPLSSFNFLPNDKILDSSKFKAFKDNKINHCNILKFVLERVKNTVGKVKKNFVFPFSTVFLKAFYFMFLKKPPMSVVNPFLNDKFRLYQTERSGRQQFWIWWKWHRVPRNGRKHCGKRIIARYEQFLLFPLFSKDLYYIHEKTRACLGKG